MFLYKLYQAFYHRGVCCGSRRTVVNVLRCFVTMYQQLVHVLKGGEELFDFLTRSDGGCCPYRKKQTEETQS